MRRRCLCAHHATSRSGDFTHAVTPPHCLWLRRMLAIMLHLPPTRAHSYDGPPLPEPKELIDLVRETMLAVDAGKKPADYAALQRDGRTSVQSRLSG